VSVYTELGCHRSRYSTGVSKVNGMCSQQTRPFAAFVTVVLAVIEKRRVRDFVIGFLTCWTLGIFVNLLADDGRNRRSESQIYLKEIRALQRKQDENRTIMSNFQVDMQRQLQVDMQRQQLNR